MRPVCTYISKAIKRLTSCLRCSVKLRRRHGAPVDGKKLISSSYAHRRDNRYFEKNPNYKPYYRPYPKLTRAHIRLVGQGLGMIYKDEHRVLFKPIVKKAPKIETVGEAPALEPEVQKTQNPAGHKTNVNNKEKNVSMNSAVTNAPVDNKKIEISPHGEEISPPEVITKSNTPVETTNLPIIAKKDISSESNASEVIEESQVSCKNLIAKFESMSREMTSSQVSLNSTKTAESSSSEVTVESQGSCSSLIQMFERLSSSEKSHSIPEKKKNKVENPSNNQTTKQ